MPSSVMPNVSVKFPNGNQYHCRQLTSYSGSKLLAGEGGKVYGACEDVFIFRTYGLETAIMFTNACACLCIGSITSIFRGYPDNGKITFDYKLGSYSCVTSHRCLV